MVLLLLIIVMIGQKINNVKVRNAALLTNDLVAYIWIKHQSFGHYLVWNELYTKISTLFREKTEINERT